MASKRRGVFGGIVLASALVGLAGTAALNCGGTSGGSPAGEDGASPSNDATAPDNDAANDAQPSADSGSDAPFDSPLAADDAGPAPDDAGPAPDDAGTDAPLDGATDAHLDSATSDAGIDSSSDLDAGHDASEDSGPTDAGLDTGAQTDASDASTCNGTCVVLATSQDSPLDIATDGVHVYWTDDNSAGTIMELPVGGGTPVALASGQSYPYGITIDSTSVYWTTYHAAIVGGTVMKELLDGGGLTTIATSQTAPAYITLQAGILYWPDENTVASATTAGVAGTTFASGGGSFIASGPSGVYWAGDGTDITTAALGSTTFTNLVTKQFPEGIAVDSTSIYFANSANNISTASAAILKVALDGTGLTTLASGSEIGEPLGITLSDGYVYWTDLLNGTIMKVPITGGTPTLLAWGQASPQNIAVDSTSVYWTDFGNCPAPGCAGSVMKLTPK